MRIRNCYDFRYWSSYISKSLEFLSKIAYFDHCFGIIKKIKERNILINSSIHGFIIYDALIRNLIKKSMYNRAIEVYEVVSTDDNYLKDEILSLLIEKSFNNMIKKDTYDEKIIAELEEKIKTIEEIYIKTECYISFGDLYFHMGKLEQFKNMFNQINDPKNKISLIVKLIERAIQEKMIEKYLNSKKYKQILEKFLLIIKNKYPQLFKEILKQYITSY